MDQECPGICSVVGGSHITTYDGKTFSFNGNCDYILTKGTETSDADGCCKTCEHSNCVRLRNTTQIHVKGCTSIGPIEVTFCSGHCDSQSM
nr:mucin-5B [Misgurnus anguillicaudatus]